MKHTMSQPNSTQPGAADPPLICECGSPDTPENPVFMRVDPYDDEFSDDPASLPAMPICRRCYRFLLAEI